MEEEAQQLSSICGFDIATATAYLEAYGSLESASNAFFDGRVPASLQQEEDVGPQEVFESPGPFYKVVWGRDEPIHQGWLDQKIELEGLGILQQKNGPCGPLACLNAVLIARILEREGSIEKDTVLTEDDVVDAMAHIVENCGNDGQVCVCTWKGEKGGQVDVNRVDNGDAVREIMLRNSDMFLGAGGIVLLVYSCVFSRGVEQVVDDLKEQDDEQSLVAGPFWLGTSELMGLMMTGKARGNVGAFAPDGTLQNWPPCEIGMLSFAEVETGIPLCDSLKCPKYPVWVIHGGDHFSLLFCGDVETDFESENAEFEVFHWNGLPPNRSFQTIKVLAENGACKPARPRNKKKWFKPQPGEIDEIIQALPEDRAKSDYYSKWRYEVILAVDDPEVRGKVRPANKQDKYPIYDLGKPPKGAWRCAACYRSRFRTMCFGQNDPGDHCVHCGKHKTEVGWTLAIHYSDLPEVIKRRVQINFGHKILNVLGTKWPDCDVEWEDEDEVPRC